MELARKRVYSQKVTIGKAVLYLGDCLDVLGEFQNNAFAVAITSPPYNNLPKQGVRHSGSLANFYNSKARKRYDDDLPEEKYQRWLLDRLDKCRAKTDGLMWVNHKIRFRDGVAIHPLRILPYPLWSEIIWDRTEIMRFGQKRFVQSHEAFYAFGKPGEYWNPVHDSRGSVWRIKPKGDPNHPCVFPEAVIEPIIIASSPIRSKVVDPFMGSGKVGVVCARNNREFVGIEIDQRSFDYACENIEAAYSN